MNAREEYSVRLEMSRIHDEFIEKMSVAYDNRFYIETVWYCYAIFEQRISRLIVKYIDKCNVPNRKDNKSAAISTRIKCLECLTNAKYGAFDSFNVDILRRIGNWCDERNDLVHALVSLKHYKSYDKEFQTLAETGVPMVFELYDLCSDFRGNWYEHDEPVEIFPVRNCKCKNQKCLNPSNI